MPTVAVDGHDVEVESRPGEPILGTLCRAGYSYRFGCRRGGCGVCKVQLISGQVVYPKTVADSVLSDSDRLGGVCLTCRAVPVSDVVIRLDSTDQLRRIGLFRQAKGTKVE
ncbi:hypothetical protein B1R94_25095 [Mycolicibacterium litorale]|nr:hypothetical protein B1R94_25095 [Mycolicibacterium litorale]